MNSVLPGNGLAGGLPSPTMAPGTSTAGVLPSLAKSHDMAKAMFDNTSRALAHIQMMSQELTSLSKLGDTVTPDDVIETAGNIVGKGSFSPMEAATVLSDMPDGGQALAGWVSQHLAQNQATMAQVQQAHAMARHEMGASGLRLLAAHSAAGPLPELAGGTAPGNPLMGGPAGAS